MSLFLFKHSIVNCRSMNGQASSSMSRSIDTTAGDDDDDDLINPGSPTAMDDTDEENLSLGAHSPLPDIRCPEDGSHHDDSNQREDDRSARVSVSHQIIPQLPETSTTPMSLVPTSLPPSILSPSLHRSISSPSTSTATSPSTSISPHTISRLSPHHVSPHRSSISPHHHSSRPATPITSSSSFIKCEPLTSAALANLARPLSFHHANSIPLMASLTSTLNTPITLNSFNRIPFPTDTFRFSHHPLLSASPQYYHPLSLHQQLPLVTPRSNPFFPTLQSHAHSTS